MPLTATGLLEELYARPERLERAASRLSAVERRLLHRERGEPWTPADVPLLDEAAELLGEDDDASRAEASRNTARRREELDYAQQVLEMSGSGGMVSAEVLADRYATYGPALTVGERAASDRTWTYGHLVVDEAQELSAMAWRLLTRRCPNRSWTVVGDVAQTGSAAGTTSWARVLDEQAPGRWRVETLSVNYRTPRQVMELAGAVLTAAGLDVDVPRSARDGDAPVALPADVGRLAGEVGTAVADERSLLDGGRMAVVVPDVLLEPVGDAVRAELGGDEVRSPDDDRDVAVTLTTVRSVKGLEFDTVVVVEPAAVVEQSVQGVHDLYVALTRPTRRLVVLHERDLPPGMELLLDRDGRPVQA